MGLCLKIAMRQWSLTQIWSRPRSDVIVFVPEFCSLCSTLNNVAFSRISVSGTFLLEWLVEIQASWHRLHHLKFVQLPKSTWFLLLVLHFAVGY